LLIRAHRSNAVLKQDATSTLIGTAAGAAIKGGRSQNIETGARISLLGGTAMGAMGASNKEDQAQTQYNIAYQFRPLR
jgi:hypothetical protein